MTRWLVAVASLAMISSCACGYLLGSWHIEAIMDRNIQDVIADFSNQLRVLEGRVLTLDNVCR